MTVDKETLDLVLKELISLSDTPEELFENISLFSIRTYCPYFFNIPEIYQEFYAKKFTHVFFNIYIRNKKLSNSMHCIERKKEKRGEFIKGWNNFIKNLKACPDTQKIGPKTAHLKALIYDNPYEYATKDDFKNKASRFWENYVCRNPKDSNSEFIPQTIYSSELYSEELPFYYILYTIYFHCNSKKKEQLKKPFGTFSDDFIRYQKYGDINNILKWCVSCYKEWYDYYKKNPIFTFDCEKYICGIPFFLEHFGYYRHKGLNWIYEDLLSVLESIRLGKPNDQAQVKNSVDIPFVGDFFFKQKLMTHHLVSGKEILLKPRKDEKQRQFSSDTNYIPRQLEKIFSLKRSALSEYFPKQYSTQEIVNGIPNDNLLKKISQLLLKEFISSIFLLLVRYNDKLLIDNDLLSYINLHLFFHVIIDFLTDLNYISEITYEQSSLIHEKINTFIWDNIIFHAELDSTYIYDNIVSFYLQEIQKINGLSEESIHNYIYRHYLAYFDD